jgi:hypothetical protein
MLVRSRIMSEPSCSKKIVPSAREPLVVEVSTFRHRFVKALRGSETGVGVSVRGNGVEDATEVALAGIVGERVTAMVGFCSVS